MSKSEVAASLPTTRSGDGLRSSGLPVVVGGSDSGVAIVPTSRSCSTRVVLAPAFAATRSVTVAIGPVSTAVVLLLFDGLLATLDGVTFLAAGSGLV
jgi:hypothetical protein